MSEEFVKTNTPVNATEFINIHRTRFELIGILNHNGSYQYGHYTSLLRKSGQWYLFNDYDLPKLMSSEHVFTRDNYMFVYRRVDIPTPERFQCSQNIDTAVTSVSMSNTPTTYSHLLGKRRATIDDDEKSDSSSTKFEKKSLNENKTNIVQFVDNPKVECNIQEREIDELKLLNDGEETNGKNSLLILGVKRVRQ